MEIQQTNRPFSFEQVFAGKTQSNDWNVAAGFLTLHVDLTAYNFPDTPIIVTSLHGLGYHWMILGGSSPYNISSTGFDIYIRSVFPNEMETTKNNAQQYNWHIQWIAKTPTQPSTGRI